MANQGRALSVIIRDNIVRGQPAQVDYLKNPSRGHFTHSSLDASTDGIRLLILEPSIIWGDVVHCRLVHVVFGQMPKYEALSYTWGSEDSQNAIVLDGKTFRVRDNLWEALIRLRMPTEERVLWIDAICINQDDISERNQQVRFMPHIYTRAQNVLVWLGSANNFNGIKTWKEWMEHSIFQEIRNDFLGEICNVNYWNRVWIVQEVGKARKIRIHYGSIVVDWETFIDTIRPNPLLKHCQPLKLADQMLDKYGDGYKLENLLKTHQQALCKDIRDKVYGFTGLANNTFGRLAMDYAKTPFEVWKDVVRFRNADTTIPQHDILQFARLVRDLLGGNLIATPDDVVNEKLHFSMVQDPRNNLVLCPARLWGRIAWVGPTYHEIRASLRRVDEWTASIRDHVVDSYLQSAYEESDLFLQLLEDIDYSDLRMVYPTLRSPEYTLNHHDQGEGLDVMSKIKPKASHQVVDNIAMPNLAGLTVKDELVEDKHLVLLDICPPGDEITSGASKQFYGIVLAPGNVRAGDFICYFYKKERAAVVRKSEDDLFAIIASAVIPDIRAMAIDKMKNNGTVKPMFAVLNSALLKSSETINLHMDIGSVIEWLS